MRAARARSLRTEGTDAERVLWQHLRSRQLLGMKFRRQHPVGPFFADFACLEARLVIEVDGAQHFEPKAEAADASRTAALQRAGFTVLRFDNRQVLVETDGVLAAIEQWVRSREPSPPTLSRERERSKTVPLAGIDDKEPA